MRLRNLALLACLTLPLPALADDASSQPPAQDIFSYSDLTLDHQHEHSDFFGDSSQGNGLKFSYDFSGVYVFGQWNKLDFETLPGSHTVQGVGVGAHQAYSNNMSFYIDLAYLQDKLSSSLGAGSDDYWRVDYGMRAQVTTMLEVDAAIFTERNTTFGRRPFGERLGGGVDLGPFSLLGAVEHTANGNRTEISLSWAYR
jgi:opacity protein-like surface antigen